MNFLVLQHLDIESPALIGDLLREAGHHLHTAHVYAGDTLPANTDHLHGIIIMGGPQSANDTHLSYIRDELLWLQKRIDEGVPMLGICLGAQLMAKAAGGSIMPSPVRELGWFPVYPTAEAAADPLFSALPATELTVFQWHGETFTLPDHATLLATHPDVPAQVFRLGHCQYGMQFHIEVDASIIENWIALGTSECAHLGNSGLNTLRQHTTAYLPDMRSFCRRLVEAWQHACANNHNKRSPL
ncbi:type 1 glutamine amidotransferase [Mariprofundus ferrooxydans]|uniref:Glutamine amidotransferase class-I n=1 Tax=Mariprofundus ferrooxydans PV-1 TaxID=314345 RepID=Q0F0E1_9PROT|nr:type 1 glutamine amidotransferase [Mariprofundus ferrooxydans]EAU55087.1 Glutamine amidotransferase class-I [Mariprofundus ferrooxydans PV-1]KON46873.1 glutamine amidotransferase [Mariprofundus ferrooxydans]